MESVQAKEDKMSNLAIIQNQQTIKSTELV
jgi:hypothetical protein